MMIRLFTPFLLLTATPLVAQPIALDNGSAYEIIKTYPEGRKANQGEYLRFHASLRTQTDSLMFTTKSGAGDPQMVRADSTASGKTEVVTVLQLMREGEIAKITMPLEQFGVKPPGLEKDSVIYYEIELLTIVSEAAFLAEEEEKKAKAAAGREKIMAREAEMLTFHADILAGYRAGTLAGIQTTESGLKYLIHEMGKGEKPGKGDPISVNYIGSLAKGNQPPFDQSYQRGEPLNFSVGTGRVIDGWDEGLLLLPKGSKATFFIPAHLGYGDRGSAGGNIPPGAELVFFVEIE